MLPSGEKAGIVSAPGSVVSGRTSIGSSLVDACAECRRQYRRRADHRDRDYDGDQRASSYASRREGPDALEPVFAGIRGALRPGTCRRARRTGIAPRRQAWSARPCDEMSRFSRFRSEPISEAC